MIAPEVRLIGYCLDCKKQHEYRCAPTRMLHYMSEWEQKHLGHRVEFRSPGRNMLPHGHRPSLYRQLMQWADRQMDRWRDLSPHAPAPWWMQQFAHNADIKMAYAASAAFTISLASLASSSTLLAGQEGTAISNTSNLYLDYHFGGKITVGTTPTTATKLEVLTYAAVNDTPTYGDVFDGTDSAETVTNAEIKRAYLKLAKSIDIVATTSDIAYWFGPLSISAIYGGMCPSNWGLFVTHSMVAALNATGGNHVLNYRGAYATAA